MRVSRVTGPSSSCVPRPITPPGTMTPRPLCGDIAVVFRALEPLDTRNNKDFVAGVRGPHARVPTLRRSRCHNRRKARYRPGGLSLDRAGFAPARRLTKFREAIALLLSSPTGIAWSHQGSFFTHGANNRAPGAIPGTGSGTHPQALGRDASAKQLPGVKTPLLSVTDSDASIVGPRAPSGLPFEAVLRCAPTPHGVSSVPRGLDVLLQLLQLDAAAFQHAQDPR
jgi:hypothetical protein